MHPAYVISAFSRNSFSHPAQTYYSSNTDQCWSMKEEFPTEAI